MPRPPKSQQHIVRPFASNKLMGWYNLLLGGGFEMKKKKYASK